jgi:molybdopterin biosynthesis enzyme
VVTGSEVYSGQFPDGFDDHVARKTTAYGCRYEGKIVVPDDADRIAAAVNRFKDRGCDMVLITGGLSVDPDDVTVSGVRRTGASIIKYGSPVLPGAMFLYARLDGLVILGLPACVFYHRTTIFDFVLPRIISGDELDAEAIAGMGHGGLCRNCTECRFPACGFGT